jgi:hypothetical protein
VSRGQLAQHGGDRDTGATNARAPGHHRRVPQDPVDCVHGCRVGTHRPAANVQEQQIVGASLRPEGRAHLDGLTGQPLLSSRRVGCRRCWSWRRRILPPQRLAKRMALPGTSTPRGQPDDGIRTPELAGSHVLHIAACRPAQRRGVIAASGRA